MGKLVEAPTALGLQQTKTCWVFYEPDHGQFKTTGCPKTFDTPLIFTFETQKKCLKVIDSSETPPPPLAPPSDKNP